MGLFSRALRAINAALNSWYSTEANATGSKNLIGNVWVNLTTGGIYVDSKDKYSALLSISATNQKGIITETNELVIKPGQEIPREKAKGILDNCATGTITWSKIVNKSENDSGNPEASSYYASIKDWGGESTKLYNISPNVYGLNIKVDREENTLFVRALNGDYKNIHVYVIGYDGSDYDFDLIDVKQGQSIAISYPATMDELLPINRISIWFELDERQISNLLDDDAIQERLDATLTRLGISEQ